MGVEFSSFPLVWLLAFTTACAAVQSVMCPVERSGRGFCWVPP